MAKPIVVVLASPYLAHPSTSNYPQILFMSDNFEKLKELTQAFARVGGHAQMDLVYADMDVEECLGTKNCEAFQQFTVSFRYFYIPTRRISTTRMTDRCNSPCSCLTTPLLSASIPALPPQPERGASAGG